MRPGYGLEEGKRLGHGLYREGERLKYGLDREKGSDTALAGGGRLGHGHGKQGRFGRDIVKECQMGEESGPITRCGTRGVQGMER